MPNSKNSAAIEVLCYRENGPSRATVRRHYLRWRQEQNPPLPIRCDNPICRFHTERLIWNGKPVKPILDHKDGNNTDNRPRMLQLLCPNCDSLQPTRGGANKGRVEKWETGFAISRDQHRDYTLFPSESFSVSRPTTKNGVACDGFADDTEKAAIARFKKFDFQGVQFDNNVIVAGGEIHIRRST